MSAADSRAGSDADAIRFDDGAAYEDFMGVWSRLAGERFLDWLAPAPGLRWADVGCGNGAFGELLLDRAGAAHVAGVDPSQAQVAYAVQRFAGRPASAVVGDAARLPLADRSVDAATMALVVFFLPDPAAGVAEMARVAAPGGSVSAYAWDLNGGGFPYAALQAELAATGIAPLLPPSPDAGDLDVLEALWRGAGLVDVATAAFAVERTFADFDAFWATARRGPRLAPRMAGLAEDDVAVLKRRVRERLGAAAGGPCTVGARVHAVRGRAGPPPTD